MMHVAPVFKLKMVKEGEIQYNCSSPNDVVSMAKKYIGEEDRENMIVVLLSTKNDIIGVHTVSIGTINATIVHPREIFKSAILSNAVSIIIIHNHPSGNPSPSMEDMEITKKIKEAGEVMSIPLIDHVIISFNNHFSFKEEGLI